MRDISCTSSYEFSLSGKIHILMSMQSEHGYRKRSPRRPRVSLHTPTSHSRLRNRLKAWRANAWLLSKWWWNRCNASDDLFGSLLKIRGCDNSAGANTEKMYDMDVLFRLCASLYGLAVINLVIKQVCRSLYLRRRCKHDMWIVPMASSIFGAFPKGKT